MFFDWLSCYQDYDFDLPIIADDGYMYVDLVGGNLGQIRQNKIHHDGSFDTSIQIHVKGRRLVVSGNPSRYNRLDNLFGFSSLDHCFAIYNHVLQSYGLPNLTKCTSIGFTEVHKDDGSIKLIPVVNGAIITALHITTNMAVGPGNCVDTYIKSLSMLPYRRSRGRLHADGKTTDWLSIQGHAREIYPSVYDKAHELALHSLPNFKRRFGEDSPEYQYLLSIIDYCKASGVTRHEQKFKSGFLNKHNLQYYGLSDLTPLYQLHDEFLNLDKKLKVSAMNLQTLTETLLSENICTNTKSANITALYAINWMNGEKFDPTKSQVQTHRARLRRIGIDILKPCNLNIFSPMRVFTCSSSFTSSW